MKHTSHYAMALICYNPRQSIDDTCVNLLADGVIFHWWYILHPSYTDPLTGENRKDHYHVELLCNKDFKSEDIIDQFTEPDPLNPDKPFRAQCDDDKERHIPLALQLEHALLYDIHHSIYLGLRGLTKPYYDLHYKDIVTDCQVWIDSIWLDCKADLFIKLCPKPSPEDITAAIFYNQPICIGDKPLTVPLAMRRHWLNSFQFRNIVGMLNTPMYSDFIFHKESETTEQ